MTVSTDARRLARRAVREPARIAAGTVVLAILLFAFSARAAFPDRPVRLIVPFAPGGASDLIARVLKLPLSQELGQPVIVENHAGANGNVGIAYVANSDPDGYKLLVASSVIFVNQLLKRPDSHDPEKDFTPIAISAACSGRSCDANGKLHP